MGKIMTMTSEAKQRVDKLRDKVKVITTYYDEWDMHFLNKLVDFGKEAKELIKEIDFND